MEQASQWDDGVRPDFLLSVNDRMLQVREKLLLVAETRAPVGICGERGLGKEALALAVHRWSPRAGGPFVRVSCTAVPAVRLAAELFGEPAAEAASPFARARGGTLYVGGLEACGPALGERLAAVAARIEAEAPESSPRLVLATEETDPASPARQLLERIVAAGAGTAVVLPPLRERPEDIGLLAQHLLHLYVPFYSSRVRQVRSSLVDLFKQYAWPGNVRELERVIRRFLALDDESAIRRELEEKVWRAGGAARASEEEFPAGMKLAEISRLAARRAEARAIRRVLEKTRWNKKAAAQELGVSYKSLLNKVRDYQLDT